MRSPFSLSFFMSRTVVARVVDYASVPFCQPSVQVLCCDMHLCFACVGYTDDPGVPEDSNTPTFVLMVLHIEVPCCRVAIVVGAGVQGVRGWW
jgi:hypothetical protein